MMLPSLRPKSQRETFPSRFRFRQSSKQLSARYAVAMEKARTCCSPFWYKCRAMNWPERKSNLFPLAPRIQGAWYARSIPKHGAEPRGRWDGLRFLFACFTNRLDAVQNEAWHQRMSFQRFPSIDLQTRVLLFLLCKQLGKVVTQVSTHGQKIGDDDNPFDSSLDRIMNGSCEIWRGDFQKCRTHVLEAACLLDLARQVAHPFIGLRHTTSVGEKKNPCFRCSHSIALGVFLIQFYSGTYESVQIRGNFSTEEN